MTHGQSHATHVDLGDPQLNERIGAGMEAVEDKLRSEIDRGQDFLKDKVSHLSKAGGKRSPHDGAAGFRVWSASGLQRGC